MSEEGTQRHTSYDDNFIIISGSGGGGIHLNTLIKKGLNAPPNKSRRSEKWSSVIFRQ